MANKFIKESVYESLPIILKQGMETFEGRERDVILMSSLAVLSGCLPNITGVYDDKKYFSNLYLLILAPPASGKGRMNIAALLAERIHAKIKSDSQAAIDKYKSENKGNLKGCPKLDVKIVPGNVSSAKLYTHLKVSKNGIVMIESEADSISAMLKQEWGDFSDVLRKAYHHEKISLSRETDDKFIEVFNPKLSLVLSGTKNQLKPLLQSHENGLFSRFLYYYFNDGTEWKDVAPRKEDSIDRMQTFQQIGDSIYDLYQTLITNNRTISFELTNKQWDELNSTLGYANYLLNKNGKISFLSSVKRHGLMLFRLAMILSTLRKHKTVFNSEKLVCEDVDFQIAKNIVKTLLDHALTVFELFENKALGLTIKDYSTLANLPYQFERGQAIAIGRDLDIPERTMDYFLNRMLNKKVLIRIKPGFYRKIKNS
ncbi:DUF3987 domain-containing protein [Allomuricauda sp. ARW1Y1]|jgi:hypothetical protein|uniref:DUF3987 domain-containing protein n=1 Tax=Allomuricauda sp. ARW1Y1 TaxID=2663843 RepID=UPI0015CEBB3B|nr:DUF3987 domain-containing protein [Muricauda sp. ARW1Y1]NYJ26616.1 hypothetical protein [Muricauda sp. ARW1Y1]